MRRINEDGNTKHFQSRLQPLNTSLCRHLMDILENDTKTSSCRLGPLVVSDVYLDSGYHMERNEAFMI